MNSATTAQPANPTLSVVIPAFNEARRLGKTLAGIRTYAQKHAAIWEVIVVDDGSHDGTAALVRRGTWRPLAVRVLENGRNRGKGFSVRRGMLASSGETRLLCDADLSTPIEEIEKLLSRIAEGADIAIGSRDLPESKLDPPQPLPRRLMAWLFRGLRRRLLIPTIRDTQCGFKCFRGDVAQEVFARQTLDGFVFDCEILALADRLGYRIDEVGVVWRHHPDSRVKPRREVFRVLAELLAVRRHLRKLERPSPPDQAH
ncbi:MAG: glycosyltransferase family 2 protein [Planctomycetes bacterium]|nr:glycosyltransferase family 2 protein [Planctomycetota bacterium]